MLAFSNLDGMEGKKKCKDFIGEVENYRIHMGLILFCSSFWASTITTFKETPLKIIQLNWNSVCES